MSNSERNAYLLASLVAFILGGVMLYYFLSGLLASYLDESFRDHVLIAGVVLIILGVFNILTLGQKVDCGHDHGDCGHDHGDDHDHGHDHSHSHAHHEDKDHAHDHSDGATCCGHDHAEEAHAHTHDRDHDHGDDHHHAYFGGDSLAASVVAALLICGSVTYAAVRSPHQFSPQAIMNKGLYDPNYEAQRADKSLAAGVDRSSADSTTTTADIGAFSLADLEAQVDRDADGYFELDVPELYYTAGDLEVRRVLEGQPVTTLAQVMPEKFNNPDGTRLRIFRVFIECCAADARPLSIPVEFSQTPPEFQEMGWVSVKGHMTYKLEGGVTVPILQAEGMVEADEPEQAMMY